MERIERIHALHRILSAARYPVTVQRLQDELVQASKLAVLGQIAASVAHEINQPVAAIRTFAETGAALRMKSRSVASSILN